MKKIISLFLVIALGIGLVSCTGDDVFDSLKNLSKSIVTTRYEVITSPMNQESIMYSATDLEYNYYLLDLGYIKNVPLSSGVAVTYNGQTPMNISFEKTYVSETSISKALTTTAQETLTTSSSGSATFEISQKFKYRIGETTLGASYSRQWGTSEEKSNSVENTYTTANAAAEQLSSSISYTIGEHGEKSGVYRLSLIATCDAYAFITTTRDNENLKNITYTFSARDDARLQLDYDLDGDFKDGKNKFFVTEKICKTLPIPTEQISYGSITVDNEEPNIITAMMARYNCNDGNQYNKQEAEENKSWHERHDDFELGYLNLYGCKQIGNTLSIINDEDFAIRYQVLHNTEDLPRNGTDCTRINNDSETRAKELNFNERIGYGAFWVRVQYTDDSQSTYVKTNALQYASTGTYIDIVTLSDINTSKTIKKIDIVLLYELDAGAAGFMGIWWHEYTNWRCEYTFSFANEPVIFILERQNHYGTLQ